MTTDTQYDVIIIGTGAGGGTLAYKLAPSGLRILLLERGDYVRRESENWSTLAVNKQGRYNTKEVWRTATGAELHPHTNYYVGGNTKFFGAALFRLRREDFGELPHHGGISPAWPISYDDMEPYYTAAERLYQVHGERGADPTEPWASAPYDHPAISHEPRIQQLHDDLVAHGHSPFHVPLGVRLKLLEYLAPTDGRPYPADERANDLVHWQTIVRTADASGAEQALRRARARFVPPGAVTLGDTAKSAVVRDPDGHAVLITGKHERE